MGSTQDPGTGSRYTKGTDRIINKDGSFNVRRTGVITGVKDLYQTLITMSWFRFFLWSFGAYLVLNLFFGTLYYFGGKGNLVGINDSSAIDRFLGCFYFSCQTFTTVGYGAIAPVGKFTSMLAAAEAFVGLVGFAFATGLVYGRFSKPSARLLFSKNAVVAPYNDGEAFMFRLVNERSNILLEMEATVILSVLRDPDGETALRDYYRLELETSRINFFPLSWTVVHPLTDDSPFLKLSREELNKREMEILINMKGFDDTFSQTVYRRHSYKCDEILWNHRFVPAFNVNDDGVVHMHVDEVHKVEKV